MVLARSLAAAIVLGASAGSADPAPAAAPKREHTEEASRLAPAAIPNLPAAVVGHLASRGCLVPQSHVGPRPQNAIQGQFFRPGQTDWAVLCSRDGESVILVYPNGATDAVEEVAGGRKDHFYVETLRHDGSTISGFVRRIQPVDAPWITAHHEAFGGPEPPPIDHQGIDDAWVEKASVVHYRHLGGWIELAGQD